MKDRFHVVTLYVLFASIFVLVACGGAAAPSPTTALASPTSPPALTNPPATATSAPAAITAPAATTASTTPTSAPDANLKGEISFYTNEGPEELECFQA